MKKTKVTLGYPENAYCAVFGEMAFPNMPADAESTLRYVLETLSQREAGMFMLRYMDKMTYREIGERSGGLSYEGTRRIIMKTERKLRHPRRSKILLMGRGAYLNLEVAKLAEYRAKLVDRPIQDALGMSIDILDLSVRSWNCLTRAGIKTVEDIMSFGDLSRVRNLEQSSIQEVRDKMNIFMEVAETKI